MMSNGWDRQREMDRLQEVIRNLQSQVRQKQQELLALIGDPSQPYTVDDPNEVIDEIRTIKVGDEDRHD